MTPLSLVIAFPQELRHDTGGHATSSVRSMRKLRILQSLGKVVQNFSEKEEDQSEEIE